MPVCPSCGQDNPEGFRLCGMCGATLAASAAREERKVVTVLFCDLVGFTAKAEQLDPEDVRAVLAPYHERVRSELKRHGGTVEKFIGDAVMALFGAPLAHEDDPERAVRAALAIRDSAAEQGIELRIGITTDEALVNLDARPDAGETMATGDVVNTAARLQAASPVNGILVSAKTYEATKATIDYRPADPVAAKGKANPVPAWEVVSAEPLQERAHTTSLVGREGELAELREALDRVRAERSPQLVTIVGPPGIGKSRIVYELAQADTELTWRKGRCLPYGDGVPFWALGEIVKAHAGILESDRPEKAGEKLRECVDDSWVESHLRPLVGVGEARETLGDRRAEAFSAWRRFLTTLAETRPLALVLEDIHWADDGLLDFVSQLAELARESPLLLLCTARPEFLERRPGWGAATVRLAPLSDDETARLLASLVDADASDELVAQAAGNPLYAEQYARLIIDGGSLEEPPTTVQAIIAARLDGLPPDEKALLLDAAVIGRVFWSGALAALARTDRWSAEEGLLALERREFLRRDGASAVEGETQYAFRHVLLRDVAYTEIPRAARADKHVRAGGWIESLGRPEDHTELLAHHYLAALELTRAAGQESSDVAERARLALRDAADRALGLGAFTPAVRHYRTALELWPLEDAERPYLLLRYGTALRWAKDRGEAELAEARDRLVQAGDPGTAAEAELLLSDIALSRGQRDRVRKHLDRASSMVAGLGASQSKAYVLGHLARFQMTEDRLEEAIELGLQALAMADKLGLDELRPHVLNTIGTARVKSGDPEGVDQLERSIELALALSAVPDVLRGYNNLAAAHERLGDLRGSLQALEDGLLAAERFEEWTPANAIRSNLPGSLFEAGEWEEAMRLADEVIAEVDAGPGSLFASYPLSVRASIRLARDDVTGALADSKAAVEFMRQERVPALLAPYVSHLGYIMLEAGARDEAQRQADEFLEIARASRLEALYSGDALLLLDLGLTEDALPLLERAPATRWREAAEHVLRGRLEQAAAAYAEIGDLPAEALLRRKAAERLVSESRAVEADLQLELALAFYRSVRATRYIRQCEAIFVSAHSDPA